MPTTKSAKKRLRQNMVRRARNRSARQTLRTQIRHVRAAIRAGDVAAAEEQFRLAAKRLDRAATHRLIHPNASARIKSRLSGAVKALKSPAVESNA